MDDTSKWLVLIGSTVGVLTAVPTWFAMHRNLPPKTAALMVWALLAGGMFAGAVLGTNNTAFTFVCGIPFTALVTLPAALLARAMIENHRNHRAAPVTLPRLWPVGKRFRLRPETLILLVFALFSLCAQAGRAHGISVSPIQMAASQPMAFGLAIEGVLLGVLVGGHGGRRLGRMYLAPPGGRLILAWGKALPWTVPWGIAAVLRIEAYQPLMGEPAWAIDWMIRLVPLTLAFVQTFELAFAIGFIVGLNDSAASQNPF